MSNGRLDPVHAYIGIGSNQDQPRKQVETAFLLLDDLPGCHVVRRSSLYRSAPFGGIEQPDFVNAVAKIETMVPPAILLSCLKELERSRGRDLHAQRWGPRVLDLDILLYGDQVLDADDLQIPHPGIADRNFVLLPLREVASELMIPGLGPVTEIPVDDNPSLISRIE